MRMVLSSAHWVDYHTNSQDMYGTVQWTLIGSNSAKPSVNQVLVLRWTSMNWEPHWGSSFYFRRYNGNKFPQSNSCHLFIYKLKCCWGQASNIQFPFDKWSILAFSLQVVKSELTHPKMGTSGCWVIRPLWHSASRAQQQVGSHPFLKRVYLMPGSAGGDVALGNCLSQLLSPLSLTVISLFSQILYCFW